MLNWAVNRLIIIPCGTHCSYLSGHSVGIQYYWPLWQPQTSDNLFSPNPSKMSRKCAEIDVFDVKLCFLTAITPPFRAPRGQRLLFNQPECRNHGARSPHIASAARSLPASCEPDITSWGTCTQMCRLG